MDEWLDSFTLKYFDLTASNKCLVIHSGNRGDNMNKPDHSTTIDRTDFFWPNQRADDFFKFYRIVQHFSPQLELLYVLTYIFWQNRIIPSQVKTSFDHSVGLNQYQTRPIILKTWNSADVSNLCITYRFVC